MSHPPQALDKRKGFGQAGKQITINTNCFELRRFPDGICHMFDVNFSDAQVKEKRLIIQFLVEKERIFGADGVAAVYDGRAILYLYGKKPWGNNIGTSKMFDVSENQARGRPMRSDKPIIKNLKVKITLAKEINMQPLGQYISGKADQSPELQEAINAMNVALKHGAYAIYPNKKNNFYVPPEGNQPRFMLTGGLEAYAAYFSSIRPGIQRIIMNFDRGVGTFRQHGNVISVLLDFIGRRDPRDLELSRMPPAVAAKVKKFLKGFTVKLSIGRDKTKTFKIRKVSDMSSSQFVFEANAGERTNVQRYIEQQYNLNLQHPYLPCVQLTKIAWYPLELILLEPGSMYYGKLNPAQTNAMLKFATQKPNQKLDAIRQGLTYMKFGSPTLRSWNLDVNVDAPMRARARLLDPPKLHYSQGGKPLMVNVSDGQWQLRGVQGSSSPHTPIDRWFVVVFASQGGNKGFSLDAAQRAISTFVDACSQYGIKFNNRRPHIHYAGECRGPEVAGHLKDAGKACNYGKTNPPQLVVTLVQEKTSPQYAHVKTCCDTLFAVPSQNLVIATLIKQKGPSYYSNVALKVNVKLLGGVNQIIAKPVKLPGFDQPTIIFGADVSHPGPGSVFPSISAVVASCDKDGVKYNTAARVQTSREEIILDLKDMATDLINKWGAINKIKPERIIFYRDGVSEGQFDEVCRREIAALRGAIQAVGRGINPKITYVICGKRHRIRFMPLSPADADRSSNVRAGTVVDNDITHPYYNDYYIVSHGGLLGTSKPTHYSVLLDENAFSVDDMQRLTFWLAHIYPRATRSVSIAAPAYYAHHLATRAKMYIGDDDTFTEISAGATPDQIDAKREETLQRARQQWKQVRPELETTFYFM